MNLGLPEMIVLFCVALLVFGPKRLPDLAQSLGKGIRDFKKAMNGEDEDKKKEEQAPAPELHAPHDPTFVHGHETEPTVTSEPTIDSEKKPS